MCRHVEHAVFANAFDGIIAAFKLRVGEVSDEEGTNFGVFAFHQLSLRGLDDGSPDNLGLFSHKDFAMA